MINEEILKLKIFNIMQKDQIGSISMSYQEFCNNIGLLTKILGQNALIMFSENTAAISFYNWDKIRFIVTSKYNYLDTDFLHLQDANFKIVGNGMLNRERFLYRFWIDICDNKNLIIIITIIYLLLYFKITITGLEKMNNSLMNIINIFIASFFVLIGILYSDKDKNINLYKKGIFDRFIRTDMYVLRLSFGALLFCNISNSIINLEGIGKVITSIFGGTVKFSKYYFVKYYFATFLTYLSIVILIICFDSIINYYIKKIRNNYFIDAFEELLKENKNIKH